MRLLSIEVRNRIWDNVVTWLRRQKASDDTSFLERRGGMDHAFVFGASKSWCKVSQTLLKSPKCLGLSHQALFDSNFIKLSRIYRSSAKTFERQTIHREIGQNHNRTVHAIWCG
mmetsp:Transcript_6377/g.21318  ORF Transcript_6377/g.21318 Transcript_6377/m.21318 type:complete len:114 (+) Transcript_6377:117-458(+)